jgi:predicted ATPase/DNA-binding SARP family transcriptional activator
VTLEELRMALLGAPRIEVGGTPISVDTRKATAVLAHLAVAGPSSRDHLAALLWPDSDQSRARGALRRTLSVLNKGLGGRWLQLSNQEVDLEEEGRWTDIDEFRELTATTSDHGHPPAEPCPTCLDRLEQAVALHRGDLLEGFAVRDAAAFDEWHYVEAERLRQELAGTLDRLINGHARAGDFESAVSHGRRRLVLDALHEPTHRRLMLLHVWSGRRADAIRQYRECVAVLDRELGVAPLTQTTALYESILAGRTPDPPRPASSTPTASPAPPAPAVRRPSQHARPFIGRTEEVARLLSAWEGAQRGHLAIIEGELGIGKTRLAERLVAEVQERGAVTLSVRCHEGEHELAFTVIADLLRHAASQRNDPLRGLSPAWQREIAPLVPDLFEGGTLAHEAGVLANSAEKRRRLLEAFRHAIVRAVGDGVPGLVLIDDLQWADDASLDAISYLCHRLEGAPLLVLFVWRSENVGADHRLRRIVSDLRQREQLTRIELARLSLDETVELVSRSGFDANPALLERLHTETEGLPLFLVEYLGALSGGLDDTDGGWVVPTGVRDLLLARLGPLSDVARQLITAAAAIGRSFDLETVRRVSGRGEEELVAALEELVDTGLIAEVPSDTSDPVFDFRHDKLRSMAYEQASLARRRVLHARIADAFDRPGRRGEPVPDALVAQHLRLAGRDDEAAARFVLAADHARSLGAHAEAISHYRAAVGLGHEGPAALHEAIGDLLTLQGDYVGAIRAYEAAAALTDDPTELARLEYELALVHGRRGDWPSAETHIEVALSSLPTEEATVLRARLLVERAVAAHRLGDDEGAQEQADLALEVATAADDNATLAQVHNVRGILARALGDPHRAQDELERSEKIADALGSRSARFAALNNLALVAGDRGEHPRALELAKTALAICRSVGDRHREAALLNNLADLLHAAGQETESLQHLKQAVAIFAEIGEPETLEPEIWKLVDW